MKKEIKKKVMKEVEEVIRTDIVCDVCKKTILSKDTEPIHFCDEKLVSYYEVMTGHNDWGNDSCDSYENSDICTDCIGKYFEQYIKSSKRGRNTAFINVDHVWTYTRKGNSKESDVE